ncbi:UDP-glycosyltransferase 91A1-like [Humulus lupulus]|uniref:UDP-glycosyltransferase 91A1-like n=1 Tax=Humulus lupulus TaxID=3486 RepID=UPI002B403E62|nr:UDP-glycosyltransferase 91A1-like [Humulus lupulus]
MGSSRIDSSLVMTEQRDVKLHIAMFPWLAFGHILPYLELAKLFAQKGHHISFLSTPGIIQRLPKLPPDLSPLINLVKLPLPSSEYNLPNDSESTSDLPREKVPLLKSAYDGLQDSLFDLLQSSKPDWLLFDFMAYWVPDKARSINIRSAYFSIFNAAALGFVGAEIPDSRTEPEDFVIPPKWVPFPSKVAFRKFEISRIIDDIISVGYRIAKSLRGCDVVAVRSCWELESEWLNLMGHILGKPVLPIGQLPPEPCVGEDDDSWRSIKDWLDVQPKRSVVYVAFGSEAVPSQGELNEIALGLELCGLPFFWVLKADLSPVELPTRFEGRTRGRGIVRRSWAPQLKILGHDSVGGFLTHSGWSSVVEALQFGIPLLLLPFTNDQGLNVRVLEEKMIGYSVPRDENDGSFTRESVSESLKMVLEKEEGKLYRDKAKEMSPIFGDKGAQSKYVDDFLDYLKPH